MIVTISSPQYLPSAELFHRIAVSDIHVILDTIPFNENGLNNRSKIKTPIGWTWLTVPVLNSGDRKEKPIITTEIFSKKPWEKKHFEAISNAYKRSKFFSTYISFFEQLYSKKWQNLVKLNLFIYDFLFKELQIDTKIIRASEESFKGKHKAQIIDILDHYVADIYFAAQNEKTFLDQEPFKDKNIQLIYQDYTSSKYKQLHSHFLPSLSIVDMLMNIGSESKSMIMKNNVKKLKTI